MDSRFSRYAKKALVVAGAALLALLLCEGVVRAYYLIKRGKADSRSEFSAPLAQESERYGWTLIPGTIARHTTPEYDYEIRINERGFRQRVVPSFERAPGMQRVLFVGDSFTFGYGVPEHERFSERVGDLFEVLEIVNRGVPGYGTDQQLLVAEDEVSRYSPDLVILGYFLDNVVRNGLPFHHGQSKPVFRLDGSELQISESSGSGTAFDREAGPSRREGLNMPFKNFLHRHSELYALLRAKFSHLVHNTFGTDERDPYPEYTTDAPSWKVTRAIFDRLQEACHRQRSNLLIVIIPEPWHLRSHEFSGHQQAVVDACGEAGIEVLDLTPALLGVGADAYHAIDGHWTARGHDAAAREIASFIKERSLLTAIR